MWVTESISSTSGSSRVLSVIFLTTSMYSGVSIVVPLFVSNVIPIESMLPNSSSVFVSKS